MFIVRAFNSSLGLFAGATLALVAAPAVQAADTQIVDVQIQRGNGEFSILLATVGGGDRLQVLTREQGNSLVADIANSRLQVDGNTNGFQTSNPIPGIATVTLAQVDANTTRITVTGTDGLPVGQVRQQGANQIVMGFTTTQSPDRTTAIQPSAAPPPISVAPAPEPDNGVNINVTPAPAPLPPPDPNAAAVPPPAAQTAAPNEPSAVAQLDPNTFDIAQSTPRSDVYVADPEITIDGAPAGPAAPSQPFSPAPVFQPRAIAPNTGDIAVASVGIEAPVLDIGSTLPVFMQVNDAQVSTVLQSLANLADMNLIVASGGAAGDAQGAATGAGASGRISLELQGESLQDAFNYVLQVSGLDASRKGRTILVGASLPASAKNLINRTFRINQATSEEVVSYLATQGASAQIVFTEETDVVNQETQAVVRTERGRPTIESLAPDVDNNSYLPLRGLSVTSDQRLNTVTVTGEPHLVQIAANFIRQLDARLRQVAVNVKIIDINLQNIGRIGTSFSFGINEAGFINQGGIGIINFGDGRDIAPATGSGIVNEAIGSAPVGSTPGQPFPDAGDFVAQLQASIENNNAKILTDPTLIVQEGQQANVNLTQEVVTDVEVERDVSDGVTTITVTTETEEVGLFLVVDVDRIDDNGFVTLSVSPEISSVGNTQVINADGINNTIALINRRVVGSGTVRIRDGQTLVLSGIIQDQDTVATSKLPILGDLPLIGTLFRRTSRETQRREVIVLLTPNVIEDTQPWGYTYVPQADQQQTGFPQLPR
ncbi:MAG: AMIN domain-containing protein [Spirulinaceae cyanobacterium]